ncbi:MAG: hypothetical protein ABIO57_02335 [Candidatus Paceibacterota bacterium]
MTAESFEKSTNEELLTVTPEDVIIQKPEDINEMHAAAREQQKREDDQEAQVMAAILKDKMEVGMRAMPEEEAGVTLIPTKEQSTKKSSSFFKKAALWGAVVGGLFMSQQAKGQEKLHADKTSVNKEAGITSKDFELPDSVKQEWTQYRAWYMAEVKKEGLSKETLNTRATIHRLMEKYNLETGSNINDELVGKVQNFFIGYKKFIEQAAKKNKVTISGEGNQDFLSGISDPDLVAGVKTMELDFPGGQTTTTYSNTVNFQMPSGKTLQSTVKKDTKVQYEAYVDTSKYDDHK